MAFGLFSRVLETTTDTGTGTLDLGGALSNQWRAFSDVYSNGDPCFYLITDGDLTTPGLDYEFGYGTYSGNTLARTTVIASSNSDAAVDWAAGTKLIGVTDIAPSDMDATALAAYTNLLLGEGTTLLPLVRMAGVILSGCDLSNNGTDATNDIDIAAGYVVSDDGAAVMAVSAITKRLDAAWAVGSGNGGLDTGSIANATYHLWAIQRSDTLVVDVLFSTSASSPTMPTNYDRKAYIGAILRESGAIVGFTQNGNEYLRKVPIQDVNASNPGTSGVLAALSVPSGVVVDALISFAGYDGSPALSNRILITSPDQTDTAASSVYDMTLLNIGGAAYNSDTARRVRTNTSRQIRYRISNSDAGVVMGITTHGWIDRNTKRLAA